MSPHRGTDTVVVAAIPRIVPVHVRLTVLTVPVAVRDVVGGIQRTRVKIFTVAAATKKR